MKTTQAKFSGYLVEDPESRNNSIVVQGARKKGWGTCREKVITVRTVTLPRRGLGPGAAYAGVAFRGVSQMTARGKEREEERQPPGGRN